MKNQDKLLLTALSLFLSPNLALGTETAVHPTGETLKVYTSKGVSPRTIRSSNPQDSFEGPSTAPVTTLTPDPSDSSIGLGLSTLPLTGFPSLSLLANFGGPHQGQFDLAVGSTSSFSLDTDLEYRYHFGTMGDTGLHLGLLARMAIAGSNSVRINLAFAPVAGLHLTLTADRKTQLSFDAGPELAINSGDIDFKLRSFSNLLGLSIHRIF